MVMMALLAGCARSPEAKKARHLERGDRYFQQEKYREAVLEYRNVLRIDTGNAQAIRQLGLAHYQLGEMGQAGRYLLRTQELEPENLEARLKLGTLYLLGGRAEEAVREAEFVLERDQTSLEGLALLAGGLHAFCTAESGDAVVLMHHIHAWFQLGEEGGLFDSASRMDAALLNSAKDFGVGEESYDAAIGLQNPTLLQGSLDKGGPSRVRGSF